MHDKPGELWGAQLDLGLCPRESLSRIKSRLKGGMSHGAGVTSVSASECRKDKEERGEERRLGTGKRSTLPNGL